jgi:hypothetical protein
VKDLKYLSFGGDDLAITHQNRFRGISLFSLALVSEASMANGVATRQRMLHFESTEGNHMPANALEMAKLSATGSTIPGSRAEAQAWLDHAGIMTKMIMGDACPLNRYLDTIRSCLRKPHLFVGWSEAEWRAFVWSGHMAYCAFMCDTTITPLAQLAGDMEARKRPGRSPTRRIIRGGNAPVMALRAQVEIKLHLVIRLPTAWQRISRPCSPLRNPKRRRT